jgi:hypothetical protein
MIKKSVFEDDLIAGMQRKLAEAEKEEGVDSLPKAVEYISSAVDILEEDNMYATADELLNILLKIAQKHHRMQLRDPRGIHDKHKPKSSEEMVRNLLEHGTVFNMADDGNATDDLLDADVVEMPEAAEQEVSTEESFEDEN